MLELPEFFFIYGSAPKNAESGTYIMPLVALSYIVASLASYTALDLATHLASKHKNNKVILHIGGSFAMGAGIWAMHFIGMLAYKMAMYVEYDPFLTFLSMFVAIAIAYFVLDIVKGERLSVYQITVGAILLGIGICAMHYTGMAAMIMDGDIRYTPGLFALSVAIAISASAAALLIAFTLARHKGRFQYLFKGIAALVMGAAICGMHYTGMAATVFIPWAECRYDPEQSFTGIALGIAGVTFLILGTALYFGVRYREEGKSKSTIFAKHQTYMPVVAAVVFGIFISFFVFYFIRDVQQKETHKYFVLESRVYSQALELLARDLSDQGIVNSAELIDQLEKQKENLENYGLQATFSVLGNNLPETEKDNFIFQDIIRVSKNQIYTTFFPKPGRFERKKWPEFSVLFGGMGITLLIAGYFYLLIQQQRKEKGRRKELRKQITEKEHLQKQLEEYIENVQQAQLEAIEAGKRLWGEKEHIRAIVDNVKEGIITINKEGIIQSFNAEAEKMFGYKKEEAIGQNVKIIVPEPDRSKHDGYLKRYLKTGEAKVIGVGRELTSVDKNGKKFPVYLNVTKIEINKELLFIGLVRDITEQKQKEQELRDAKETAEAASAAKGDFLANMSHEIRTPMNGVLGMAGLLLDTKLTAEQHGWANIIKTSGENLLDIINDILDFSKIEAGKLELEPINFNLSSAVEEVTDVLRLQTQEKGLELLVQFAPDVPEFVVGDPGRVRQILLNLTNNAIKFTEKGHVLIEIKAKKEGKKKVRLFFEVQDTGIGISKDKVEYIFNKFSQAEESTTRKFGGTGLGLAICKSLTEMMEGSIRAKSELGKGSVFYFDILLPIGTKEEINDNIPKIDLKGYRALVVDDYKTNCEILYQYLHSWGMECDVFYSAEEAYEAANKAFKEGKPYDVALADYRMGGMSGLEFTQKIRKNKNLKDKLLVMVTSAGQIAPAKELKKKGLTGFLTKPFYPEQLKALLKIILYSRENNKKLDKLVTRHMVTCLMRDEADKATSEIKQYPDKRILVVEDMKVNLMLLTKILEKYGVRVDSAANGLEGLDMLKKFEYDLVFMDCQMPEMDGFEATKALRKHEKKETKDHTTIIALTADAMTGDQEKCLNAGMDDYLNKPVKTQEIADMMEKWLNFSTPEEQ